MRQTMRDTTADAHDCRRQVIALRRISRRCRECLDLIRLFALDPAGWREAMIVRAVEELAEAYGEAFTVDDLDTERTP
jgi:hypothetical protein